MLIRLRTRGDLDLTECTISGTFIVAKKRGRRVGKTKQGKGTFLLVADAHGFSIACDTNSASRYARHPCHIRGYL